EVRQSDIDAVREREQKIVVPEIQRTTHALGIAVDEAEHALVGTFPNHVRRRDDAERFARVLLDLVDRRLAARGRPDLHLHERLRLEETEIDRVPDRLAVDADDPAPDLELELFGDRPGEYC